VALFFPVISFKFEENEAKHVSVVDVGGINEVFAIDWVKVETKFA
jgi:hypothetical protein